MRCMTMKVSAKIFALLAFFALVASAQNRTPQTHTRSMIHQTVYNTGELGRAFDGGQTGMTVGFSSMEWPPNSRIIINKREYEGQHNSMGGGFYLAGTLDGTRQTVACGAVASAGNGQTVPVAGVYSFPGSISRTENYPVLANGTLNPAYNPNEAEEIIVATWTTPLNITVTRTSRAWSFPGYNCFIIYEYDLVSTNSDPITDAFVGWGYGLCPSMFGYERLYNEWSESNDMRAKDMYARFDLKRWMSYNQERIGKPDADFFDLWSQPGDRGGLDSPQAVGFLPLYYDHDHLAVRGQTNYPAAADSAYVWDETNRIKQPYTNRYENRNVDITKITSWTDIVTRKTQAFGGTADSTSFSPANASDWPYWKGRAKPSSNLGWKQPVVHGYVFGPYTFPPNEHLHFTIAEVIGYGAGDAGDTVYTDMGGGVETSGNVFHPVSSWYNQLTYASAGGNPPVIGSTYLHTHPLPWFVTPGVVSIRDVADRAIQMYTGSSTVVKYDSIQFDPRYTPQTGHYANSIPIPVPAPVFTVENTSGGVNKILWGDDVESFTTQKLDAPFSYYMAYRSFSALGPWTLMDSVGKKDPRYWRDSTYVLYDRASNPGEDAYYILYSVDARGMRSGVTNLTLHNTQSPAAKALTKVWVVPNPLFVTNGAIGTSTAGDFNDKIGFFGLTQKCTIRIFSYSGALVQTIYHDTPPTSGYSQEWFQITRNNQLMASGVYFFTVDDAATGKRATGKFVVIH
jgi:hypothetical protein